MTRRLLIAGLIASLLGYGIGVLRPRENPYQGLYLHARCATAFELDIAVRGATDLLKEQPSPGLTGYIDYLRERRGWAVRNYNQAADRLARKGVHAGHIVPDGQNYALAADRPNGPTWDCNRLLADLPQAPADALGGQR